jgi:cation:H+ antiporter
MLFLYILYFIIACVILYFAGQWIVEGLQRVAKFLEWKEFVVAFILMAFAGSLPNIILAVFAVANGMPELSFGDVVGGNVVDMTLVIALAALFARDGIPARGATFQTSSLFTMIAALLPLVLFMDGQLSRFDGALLLGLFFSYVYWLFSKQDRFKKVYNNYTVPLSKRLPLFMRDLGKVLFGTILLVFVAQGIVFQANKFSIEYDLPLAMVGVLIVGLGNSFPELYFSIASARKGETRMILGDLMGAVIIPATLVLGFVALVSPIVITDFSLFATARYFLIAASVLFFVFIKTDRKVSKKEAIFLLLVYIAFLLAEIFVK